MKSYMYLVLKRMYLNLYLTRAFSSLRFDLI